MATAAVTVQNDNRGRVAKPLPRYRRIAFGTGHFLTVLAIPGMWFPYSIHFFQKVLEIPAKSVGYIFLIGQIGGAISTPFLGHWSDQCVCRVPGQRKVFQLLGVISMSSAFFFLWHECFDCSGASPLYKVIYFSSFAIVVQFGWAAQQIGQQSLMPELATSKDIQTELSVIWNAFTLAGSVMMFGCLWGLLQHIGHSKEKEVYWIMALVVIVVGTAVSMIFQLLVPEKRQKSAQQKLPWYRWIINPKLYLTALCFVSARIIVNLSLTYLPLYLQDTLKMDHTSIAKGPLVLYISSFIFTLGVNLVRKFIGDKMTFFVGMAVVWGALIWFWVKGPTTDQDSHFNWTRDSIYGAVILLGAGGAIVMVIALANIPALVGKNTGSSAFVFGWMQFADRLSSGVIVQIIQLATPGASAAKQLQAEFYCHVFIFTPFAASALGLFTILAMWGVEVIQKRRQRSKGDPINRDRMLEDSASHNKPVLTAKSKVNSESYRGYGAVNQNTDDN